MSERIRIGEFVIIDENVIGRKVMIEINWGCEELRGLLMVSGGSVGDGFGKDR